MSSRPSLHLKSRKKLIADKGKVSTRVHSASDTLARIIPICMDLGVTRVADITYLDKLYIPNYIAVLPGTEDSIWVYSGKGATKAQAEASALMETIERYSSLSTTYSNEIISGTFSQLTKSYHILHPDEVVESVLPSYSEKDSVVDFLPAYDLLNNENVLVPSQLAFSRYSLRPTSNQVFQFSHTNGLASGNVLEEAICHALFEVIERDAVSIADLCASSIPYSILENMAHENERLYNNRVLKALAKNFVDDPTIFSEVDISELAKTSDTIQYLLNRFANSNIPILIKDLTQKDIDIPTFVASSVEWISKDYAYFAKGYGTHPDPEVALIRAITEMAQTRAGNIQGSRDDLRAVKYNEDEKLYNKRWQFMPQSLYSQSKNQSILISSIRAYVNTDMLDDLNLVLNRLRKAGFKRALIVDLTNPKSNIPVVRAIVPGLETFEVSKLFEGAELFMGRRAKKFFRSIHRF